MEEHNAHMLYCCARNIGTGRYVKGTANPEIPSQLLTVAEYNQDGSRTNSAI